MDDLTALPTEADYRRYDRIWQRVSPELTPYPEARAAQDGAAIERRPARAPDPPNQPGPSSPSRLPGPPSKPARPDAAPGTVELIQDFVREELANAQTYRYLAGQSPTAEGRRLMQRLAADETAHVKTLQAAYFLLTGETYRVTVVLPPQPKLPWRDRLREQYHASSRGGAAYERAAEETRDKSLRQMFGQLSQDEYRHAELLRGLIEKTL